MAIPHDRRIGWTRLRLAFLLAKAFPELQADYPTPWGFAVDPLRLIPQIPTYASPKFDCCSWDSNLPLKTYGFYHIYSWDRMGELIKLGFDFSKEGYDIELSANEVKK